MRTLAVIAEMGSGGAESVVADLTGRLVDAGHEVGVASNGGWQAERLRSRGVRTVDVPLRDSGTAPLLASALRVRHELVHHPVDVVHTHNVRATLAAALGRLGTRRQPRLLTTVHGLGASDYPRAARLLSRCSDLVAAVSDDVAARLVAGGLSQRRVVVVENAVPSPEPQDRGPVLDELGLGSDVPVVLCAARLESPKRVDLLIDAWSSVPEAVLLVAGDGPDRAALERRARGSEGVRILGDRRDVGRLLAAADLLVLPSDREGLPMSVLEAMAAGVPVVASRVGGLADLDPAAVALVAPGRVQDLAATITSLLADHPAREAQAAYARELVGRRYSSDRMRDAYESLYVDLISKSRWSVTDRRPSR
ncbi:MAG: glycosyltransferase family 4 protein [Nocardioides sp.]